MSQALRESSGFRDLIMSALPTLPELIFNYFPTPSFPSIQFVNFSVCSGNVQ
jgi:hypothetical protein